MAYKKNTAVTGFGIGHFINASTGAAVITGTPTCKRTLDGTGGACANAAAYNTDGAVWEIDLAAGDMNADHVILSFTLTDCLPISYAVKTETKLVSELNDTDGTGITLAADQAVNTTKIAGAAVATGTAQIGVNVVTETDVDFGDLKKASLNAATPDLSAITGDKASYKATGFNTTTPPTVGAIADQVWDEVIADHTNVLHFGGKNQKVVPSETVADYKATSVTVSDKTGFSLSTAGILAIWHQLTAAVTTASTMGKLVIDYLNATVSSRSSHTAAGVKTAIEAGGSSIAQILADTSTTIPGTITTAQNDLDLLTGADGATLATTQPNYSAGGATAEEVRIEMEGSGNVLDQILTDTGTTIPDTITTAQTAITFIENVLEGDVTIDTTTTPWQMVVKTKGTATELIRKNLKDKDGANITSTTTVIAQKTEPA